MWKDLNIALKSLLMSIFLRNGIDNINQMKSMYNQFQNGGPKVKNTDKFYSTMERVAEENNAEWNRDRIRNGERPLTVDEDFTRILNANEYDYRGYYSKYPNGDGNAINHWTDEFKTVYHPTFSDESKYSGKKSQYNPDGLPGGFWAGESFIPRMWQVDESNRFNTGGPTEKQRRALATQYFWENKMDKARQYAVPSVYEGGQLPEITVTGNYLAHDYQNVAPTDNTFIAGTGRTQNPELQVAGRRGGEQLHAWHENHPVLSTIGTVAGATPFVAAAYPFMSSVSALGETAYTAGATPLIMEGMNVPFAASGLNNLAHGNADWQTALEIAPLASYARPMWNAGKAIYNAGKTALYNNVDKLPWVYNIPENERMAYRIISPAEKQWLLQGNELSTMATNPTALKNARAAVEAERAANPNKIVLFKAGAEHGGRKQFAKGQPWGGTTTTFGEKQVLAIPGENLPWVSGRHYLGPQGRGFKVGPVSFDDAPFGTHIDLQTNEAGFSGVNPSQLEGSVIYSPFKLFGRKFGYRVNPVKGFKPTQITAENDIVASLNTEVNSKLPPAIKAAKAMRAADNDIKAMNTYHDANVAAYNEATGSSVKSIPFRTDTGGRRIKVLPKEDFDAAYLESRSNAPTSSVENVGGFYKFRDDTVYLRQNGSPSNAYHEFLHSDNYGITNPEVTKWRIDQLVDPEKIKDISPRSKSYYLSETEFPVHLRQQGENLGIKVGEPFPGEEAFDEMLLNTGHGGASVYVKGMSTDASLENKKLAWKALNGTLFNYGLPALGITTAATLSNQKALGGNLFADGGILGDVTRGMKVDTDQCATWSNRLLRNNGYLISGNAWNLNDVDTLFNGFAGLLKPLTYNRKDVEAYNHMASDNVYKNFDSNTLDKTKPYVVNMFYNNSPALKDAYNDGRNVTGTHTGLLTYDESKKKWIVTHNIHGKIHQENFVPLLSGKGKYGVTAIYQPREDNIFNRVRGFLGFSDGGFIDGSDEFDRVMRPLNEYRLR